MVTVDRYVGRERRTGGTRTKKHMGSGAPSAATPPTETVSMPESGSFVVAMQPAPVSSVIEATYRWVPGQL